MVILIPSTSYIYADNTCNSEIIIESNTQTNPSKIQATFEGKDNADLNTKMEITLQAITEDTTPTASFSTEKIILNRYLGFGTSHADFMVKMSDDSIPLVKDVTATKFFIADKTASSVAEDQKTLTITKNFVKQEQNYIITITDDSEITTLGKYVGKLSVIGDNFETKHIDVEYKVQWHPGLLVLFTMMGVIFSLISGFWLLKAEKIESKHKERKAKMKILDHINDHVKYFNDQTLRTQAQLTGVKTFYDAKLAYLKQNLVLQNDISVIDLEKTPKGTLEAILTQYHRKFEEWYGFISESDAPTNYKPCLDEFDYDKVEFFPEITLRKKSDNTTTPISDLIERKKTVTFFSTVIATIISIPVTLFAVTYFSGIPIIDIFIAVGIGFGVYRFKDIGKMLKGLL